MQEIFYSSKKWKGEAGSGSDFFSFFFSKYDFLAHKAEISLSSFLYQEKEKLSSPSHHKMFVFFEKEEVFGYT